MSLSKYNTTTKELEPIAGGFNVQGIIENIGDLTELETTDKSSLVDAINEVKGDIPEVDNALSTSSTNALQNKVITSNILAIENVTGAKNFCPKFGTGTASSGVVSYTANADNSFTVTSNGATASGSQVQCCGSFVIPKGIYQLSFALNNDEPTGVGVAIILKNKATGSSVCTSGDSATARRITLAENTEFYFSLYIVAGVIDTQTFYPMIRPAGTDPTYVPYSMTNRELTERVEFEGDGVSAIKAGYMVTVRVAKTTTDFSVAWNVLDTLPSAFRPKKKIRFNCADDNTTSWINSLCLPMVIDINGEVKVWGFNSHLSMSPVGCITYIV